MTSRLTPTHGIDLITIAFHAKIVDYELFTDTVIYSMYLYVISH